MKVTRVDTIRCDDDGPSLVPPGTEVVATELIIEGGPMRYRPPKPLDAEQVEKIVRAAVRAEMAADAPAAPMPVPAVVDDRTGVDAKHDRPGSADIDPAEKAVAENHQEWLTVTEACAYAKYSRQTLWRWKKQKPGLKSGRGGRVRRSDLDAWLAGIENGEGKDVGAGEWLTLRQAAARAGRTTQTIWRWRNSGLKSSRRGRIVRIRADVLDKFLEGKS